MFWHFGSFCVTLQSNSYNMEKQDEMTAVMGRLKAARERKRELMARFETEMKADYERATGRKANYFFAM